MRRRQANAVGRSRPADPFKELAERVENRPLRYDELSDSILADCYEGFFGKPPHHRMKRETIVERLNDLSDGRA